MEECGVVSLGQGIPSQTGIEKKGEGPKGEGMAELGLFLRCLRGGCRVLVAYFQFLETRDMLSLLKVTQTSNAVAIIMLLHSFTVASYQLNEFIMSFTACFCPPGATNSNFDVVSLQN